MSSSASTALPVRAGVFATASEVEAVINKLFAAGFTHDEIAVVCSDHAMQEHFREFAQAPAGANLPTAAAAGGITGAALAGITTAAIGFATGALPVAIIGGAGAMTGGVVGSLLGALLTRGGEPESADFYDQAVQKGLLLVVVERRSGDNIHESLATAEQIFSESGTRPLPLPEG